MNGQRFDAIVVGARAAGAATAMLLARQGINVLAVDRAAYGSDTLSTHALMRPAVLQLHRWGLLDRIRASGAPPIREVMFHYPGESVRVELRAADGVDALYAPRRTVLDAILADAAREAGADVRFGVAVSDLLRGADGRVEGIVACGPGGCFEARAGIVIGADGIRSLVATAARAETIRESAAEGAVVYGYFKNTSTSAYEWAYGAQLSAGIIPTNGGEACVFVGGASHRFRDEVFGDLGAGFARILRLVAPELAGRVAAATPASRLRGFAGVRGFYRRPFGPGWALVGDAGYFRDPITTHGLTDALRDAELVARAVTGSCSFADYERLRAEMTAAMFDATERIASYDWSMDELRAQLLRVSRATKPEMEMILGWAAEASAAPPLVCSRA